MLCASLTFTTILTAWSTLCGRHLSQRVRILDEPLVAAKHTTIFVLDQQRFSQAPGYGVSSPGACLAGTRNGGHYTKDHFK